VELRMKIFAKLCVALLPMMNVAQNLTLDSNNTFSYAGPVSCYTDNTILGYMDIAVLVEDMYIEAYNVHLKGEDAKEEYIYRLCPDTVYNMDSLDLSKTIMPLLNNTSIQCGKYGSSTDNCMLYSGIVQVVLSIGVMLSNISFRGLTFSENYGISVGAWAFPSSDVTFEDCHWHFNNAATVIEMYYDPSSAGAGRKLLESNAFKHGLLNKVNLEHFQYRRRTKGYPSMAVTLKDCTFKSNVMEQSVILDGGGELKIINTDFVENKVGVFTIGALFGSKLFLKEGTKFTNNNSPAFTVFVDNDSSLELNENTYENGSTAEACAGGIFVENDAAYCLYQGGLCHGTCCKFGNSSCDNYLSDSEIEEVTMKKDVSFQREANFAKNEIYTSGDDSKKCTRGCLVASILLPILVVTILVFAVFFTRKRRTENVQLGNEPVNHIS